MSIALDCYPGSITCIAVDALLMMTEVTSDAATVMLKSIEPTRQFQDGELKAGQLWGSKSDTLEGIPLKPLAMECVLGKVIPLSYYVTMIVTDVFPKFAVLQFDTHHKFVPIDREQVRLKQLNNPEYMQGNDGRCLQQSRSHIFK